MPLSPTPSCTIKSLPVKGMANAMRMVLALLIAVALPAQALSSSVERAWNAAHYHLGGTVADVMRTTAGEDAGAVQSAAAQHYPMQRIQDIAQGRTRTDPGDNGNADASRLDAHAEAHRADTPHHHDNGAPGVV